MIEKLTTKVSINTRGEAIRFAEECYEVADEYAIDFACWCESRNDKVFKTYEELLEIYKKTL